MTGTNKIFPYLGVIYATVSGFFWLLFSYIGIAVIFLYTAGANKQTNTEDNFIVFLVLSTIHWIVSVIWAATAASNHNKKLEQYY